MTIDPLAVDEYDLSPATAAAVLWAFDRGGVAPSDITRALLDTMARADDDALDRLALSYPALTAAYRSAAFTDHGIDRLRAIARAGGYA